MNSRRRFLGSLALSGLTLANVPGLNAAETPTAERETRENWVAMLRRVTEPVLASLAENQLKLRMPVEVPRGGRGRQAVTHLEAVGRTIAGIAPWLACAGLSGGEEEARVRLAELARRGLANVVLAGAADHLDFTAGAQNLVDAAFLALGLARGRAELWDKLEPGVRTELVAALQSTRKFKPNQSNWLLFSAMIEAFSKSVGAEWREEPIEAAVTAHEKWYKGDGAYGDGEQFHWDYYNSFVIQPMLFEVLELVSPSRWDPLRENVLKRAVRYAAVQERFIAPDGSYPPIGRSLAYRCGAFHHLANMALRRQLPKDVTPAQVRGALSAVIERTLGAPQTFDAAGWLQVGVAGHQPALAEPYISTGSLYLCTLAFLPLGLPPADDFWSGPAADWTSRKLWKGGNLPADHAL